ncbi:hypothetical protein HNQ04_002667, partial [Deinococcus radiopugnans ATCC 19172]|nr:hypothetical protein [Deinococcus radiopugnans ATCC 19172]
MQTNFFWKLAAKRKLGPNTLTMHPFGVFARPFYGE